MSPPSPDRRRDPRRTPKAQSYPRPLRWLVPEHHRATLRHHPLALWLSFGIFLTGVTQLIHPFPTSTDLVLPEALRIAFYVTWTLGGGLGTFGILRGKARFEAAGMALLATGLIVDFASVLYLAPERAWAGAGFLVALAIGCFMRARALVDGYEVIVDREGIPWKE